MILKIETVGLVAGLIGSGLSFSLVSWFGAFPQWVREHFSIGELGFQFLLFLAAVGICSFFLFIANVISGHRKWMWFRASGFLFFLFLCISFGLWA